MSYEKDVRVAADGQYGHAAPAGKPVMFPGQLAPTAPHVPGQPATIDAFTVTAEGIRASEFNSVGFGFGTPTYPVDYKQLHPAAVAPRLGTAQAAGYDLATPVAVTVKPGERVRIPLGLALALPQHLHGRIESRSGLAYKGLVVLTGVIDADYRGEVMVIMQNFSSEPYEFAAGDRVAQLVLRQTVHATLRAVEELPDTARGAGGFGSSGR